MVDEKRGNSGVRPFKQIAQLLVVVECAVEQKRASCVEKLVREHLHAETRVRNESWCGGEQLRVRRGRDGEREGTRRRSPTHPNQSVLQPLGELQVGLELRVHGGGREKVEKQSIDTIEKEYTVDG